jgi:hypothetical protein
MNYIQDIRKIGNMSKLFTCTFIRILPIINIICISIMAFLKINKNICDLNLTINNFLLIHNILSNN